MVSWLCRVIIPVLSIALIVAGAFLNQSMLIAGSVLLGLAVINEICYWIFSAKAGVTKKDAGFPDKRNIVLRVLVVLYAVVGTLFIAWPIAYIIQLVFTFTIGLILPEKTRLTIQGLIMRASSNLFSMWLSPFWSVRVIKYPKKGIPPGTIMMPNHLTFSDAFIMSSAVFPVECKYVATSWVFKLPIGGWMTKRGGDLPIRFKKVDPEQNNGKNFITDKEVVKKTMTRAGEYLKMGLRMNVFPEGSLAKDGQLQEFKDGFFRLAIDNEASITPVGIWGSQTLWVHGELLPQPGYAEIAIGDAIEVSKDDNLEDLKAKVRSAVLELRNGLPLYQKTKKRKLTTVGQTSQWALSVPPNFV